MDDMDEVRKFEEIAGEWWDPDGRFRLLHQLNPTRLGYICKGLTGSEHGLLSGLTIADIGCGGGILAESMNQLGARVVGIDRSERIIGVAHAHQAESGSSVDYRVQSVEEMAQAQPHAFDAVAAMEVLEHVPDVSGFVGQCARLLKPGGVFFFATLNRTPFSYLGAIIGAEWVLRWLPRGTHDFKKFLKPSEVDRVCRENGILARDVSGVTWYPLADEWRLTRRIEINYIGYGVKP